MCWTGVRRRFAALLWCVSSRSVVSSAPSMHEVSIPRPLALPLSLPQTLDLHVEMADSHLLLLMPLCLPWKILYTALQRSPHQLSVNTVSCDVM